MAEKEKQFPADAWLAWQPYAAAHAEKHAALTEALQALTLHHMERCPEYRAVVETLGFDAPAVRACTGYEALPFLPVRMFKAYALKSVPDEDVVKTMTSSGTTGQQVSRIFLDRATSAAQSKVMARIVGDFLGKKRLPMIILDTRAVLKNRAMFSARGAGILGFSMFGRDRIYAMDEEMRLDVPGIRTFLERHAGEDIFLFGFTFMVWKYFYQELVRLKAQGVTFDLSRGVLIHGGGWKKLAQEAVDAAAFRAALHDVCGIERVYNYYGMVEQTGSIFMECECGHLHASAFSDVIVRSPVDWSVQPQGREGLIEVVSCLPGAYPGHALLTEDMGVIDGEDDCPCGRKGTYFRVLGRARQAELRGCSDTYEDPGHGR